MRGVQAQHRDVSRRDLAPIDCRDAGSGALVLAPARHRHRKRPISPPPTHLSTHPPPSPRCAVIRGPQGAAPGPPSHDNQQKVIHTGYSTRAGCALCRAPFPRRHAIAWRANRRAAGAPRKWPYPSPCSPRPPAERRDKRVHSARGTSASTFRVGGLARPCNSQCWQ